MFLVDIVQNILRLAKEKKITNQQLCKILETNPNKIYDWKIGKSKPSAEDISKLADYFDVSTDYLLGRQVTESSVPENIQQLLSVASRLSCDQLKDLLQYAEFIESKNK